MFPILKDKSALTMTSQEIASLVNSRHDSVKRTIERLVESGSISNPPMVDGEKSGNGVISKVYQIGKRDSYVIVAQLSPEFTAALVDRWQELENQTNPMAIAATMNSAQLSVLMAETQAKEFAQEKLAIAAPKADALDLISDSTDSRCIRDTAKELKCRPSDLTKYLLDNKWVYRQSRDDNKAGKIMAYQHRIDQGFIKHISVAVELSSQTRLCTTVAITGKGFAKLAVIFSGAK